MNTNEILSSLERIWENFRYDGDRETYRKILVLLDDMRYLLRYDLQVDTREYTYDEFDKMDDRPFEF